MVEQEGNLEKPNYKKLLLQGVSEWNTWRKEHPFSDPQFFDFALGLDDGVERLSLAEANLQLTRFIDILFYRIDMRRADLRHAEFMNANLLCSKMDNVNLTGASLGDSKFTEVSLTAATLKRARLAGTDLTDADLTDADLTDADLTATIFNRTKLHHTNFRGAQLDGTIFCDVDLSTAKALDTVSHKGPSTLGINTILRSQGMIPDIFLRGLGVPDEFFPPIQTQIHQSRPVFWHLYYDHQDKVFAEHLWADLQHTNVRCWLHEYHSLAVLDQIKQCLVRHENMMYILSLNAGYTLDEGMKVVLEREKLEGKQMMIPLYIDTGALETPSEWLSALQQTHQIHDFTQWQNTDAYDDALNYLLLNLEDTI